MLHDILILSLSLSEIFRLYLLRSFAVLQNLLFYDLNKTTGPPSQVSMPQTLQFMQQIPFLDIRRQFQYLAGEYLNETVVYFFIGNKLSFYAVTSIILRT